jgi:hypothetical protein
VDVAAVVAECDCRVAIKAFAERKEMIQRFRAHRKNLALLESQQQLRLP